MKMPNIFKMKYRSIAFIFLFSVIIISIAYVLTNLSTSSEPENVVVEVVKEAPAIIPPTVRPTESRIRPIQLNIKEWTVKYRYIKIAHQLK